MLTPDHTHEQTARKNNRAKPAQPPGASSREAKQHFLDHCRHAVNSLIFLGMPIDDDPRSLAFFIFRLLASRLFLKFRSLVSVFPPSNPTNQNTATFLGGKTSEEGERRETKRVALTLPRLHKGKSDQSPGHSISQGWDPHATPTLVCSSPNDPSTALLKKNSVSFPARGLATILHQEKRDTWTGKQREPRPDRPCIAFCTRPKGAKAWARAFFFFFFFFLSFRPGGLSILQKPA
jgi:hypothetical protein